MAALPSTRIGTGLTKSVQGAARSKLAGSPFCSSKPFSDQCISTRSHHPRCLSTGPERRQETPIRKTSYGSQSNGPARATSSTPYQQRSPPVRQPPPETARNLAANPPQEPIREIVSEGLSDQPAAAPENAEGAVEEVDWARSFQGLSSQPFSKEAQEILMKPIEIDDIEIKPDGILYLPEIKYRRILNRAFGPGGWGLAPRGETIVTQKCVTREYALLASGRLVSIARGEQDYFDAEGIPTATEGCKSNALMRCCKDLGVASELWDPRYIRRYMAEHAKEIWVEHLITKKKKKMTMRKDDQVKYPFKEVKNPGAGSTFA